MPGAAAAAVHVCMRVRDQKVREKWAKSLRGGGREGEREHEKGREGIIYSGTIGSKKKDFIGLKYEIFRWVLREWMEFQ